MRQIIHALKIFLNLSILLLIVLIAIVPFFYKSLGITAYLYLSLAFVFIAILSVFLEDKMYQWQLKSMNSEFKKGGQKHHVFGHQARCCLLFRKICC